MILQELTSLYERLLADPKSVIPDKGQSLQNITFRETLNAVDGSLVSIDNECLPEVLPAKVKRQPKLVAQKKLVLGGGKPSGSGLNPCFLWDNSGYLLGYKGDGDEAHEERARASFAALRDKHLAVESRVNHPKFSLVCRFLEQWDPCAAREKIPEDIVLTGNGVFMIQGDSRYVHEIPEISRWWLDEGEAFWYGINGEAETGMCLVTGRVGGLAQLHEPAIKGVAGAQMSGAKIVSFNCASFVSYGKEQSYNAPVGEETAFAYCNALNYLLGSSNNKQMIAGTTSVFWTDAPRDRSAEVEELFSMTVVNPPPVFDDILNKRVKYVVEQLAKGMNPVDKLEDADVQFFFLGLEPNASRLSVSFWHVATLGKMLEAVGRHMQDLSLQRQWTEENSKKPETLLPSPHALLRETVRDPKDIPKPFFGALMRSILLQLPYPDAMAAAILLRMRLDHTVNYLRCAFLKAWLTRHPKHSCNITTMLDENNKEPGYLAGRLFAAYEKTQIDANQGRDLNATIRDRYYSSASASPLAVMSTLKRTYNHHLGKLMPSERDGREELIRQIMGGINAKEFPAHLNLKQQALFTIGYYHQMRSFYTKRSDA